MGALPRKWIKWIAVLLGVVGMLTPALLELGWIPENQAMKAVVFLLGFIVLDGARRESSESLAAPELLTSSEDYAHAVGSLLAEVKHEIITVSTPSAARSAELARLLSRSLSVARSEKQLHFYAIVVGRISELSEEFFERFFAMERDPSLEGRVRIRIYDAPVSFGCMVHDRNWAITFPPNPNDPRGVAILFRNHPEGVRLLSSFIHHQWLEQSGVTISLSEAYEKWKAIKGPSASVG
jgi:hypothetical protein